MENESDLDTRERAWARSARSNELFQDIYETLRTCYIPLVMVPRLSADAILKIRRTEGMPNLFARASQISQERSRIRAPYRLVAVDLPDFGWAQSDHFQFLAGPGTFMTDATNIPARGIEMAYTEQSSPARMAFYAHELDATPSFFVADVWPTPRGALRPTLILVTYVAMMLLFGAVSEFLSQWYSCNAFLTIEGLVQATHPCQQNGFLWALADNADAALVLSFAGPTLTLAYVLRDSDPSIRLYLLERWRHLAVAALAPGLLGSVALIINRDLLAPWALWAIWLGLSLPAMWIAATLAIYWTRVASALKAAHRRSLWRWSTEQL